MKQLVACSCDANKSHKQGVHEGCQGTLDSIWKKVTELCQSDSFKKFLRNRGRLSSLSVNQGGFQLLFFVMVCSDEYLCFRRKRKKKLTLWRYQILLWKRTS